MKHIQLVLASTLLHGAAAAALTARAPQAVPIPRAAMPAAASAASPALLASPSAAPVASIVAAAPSAASHGAEAAAAATEEGGAEEKALEQLKRLAARGLARSEDYGLGKAIAVGSISSMNDKLGGGVARVDLEPIIETRYGMVEGGSDVRAGTRAIVYYRTLADLVRSRAGGARPRTLYGLDGDGREASFPAAYAVQLDARPYGQALTDSVYALNGDSIKDWKFRAEPSPRNPSASRQDKWIDIRFESADELLRLRRSGSLVNQLKGVDADGRETEFHVRYGVAL